MDANEVIGAAAITVAVIVLIVIAGTRRRVQRRLFRGTGLEEWRQAAAQLSWRDRWVLMRANARGHATEPRLARLAVQRAEMMIAANERTVKWGVTRWLLTVSTALFAAAVLTQVVWSASTGDGWRHWPLLLLNLPATVILGFLGLFWTRLHQRDQRRLRRSAALNAELLNDSPQRTEGIDD